MAGDDARRGPISDAGRSSVTAEDVAEAINSRRSYEAQRSTLLGKGLETVTSPVARWIAAQLGVSNLRQALEFADGLSAKTLSAALPDHDLHDIGACRSAALQVQALAQGAGAASGGATGWFGAAGLAVDVPATIGLAARTVRATGICYGFDGNSTEERDFRLMVLGVATAQADAARTEALERINAYAVYLDSAEGRWVAGQAVDWLSEKLVERIARQIGVSLAGRKAGQIVPVIGGLIGAAINASFQADVARAARYAYETRWLSRRSLLPAPDA